MIFYNIIISPIETIIDWLFSAIRMKIPHVGIIGAILGVSLCVNFLTLPLYNLADKIKDEERKKVKSLEKWVLHIKKTFKGDERFMMLSEYYRQNHYHPIYALRNTLSLLIQVPFFIAAYHYLNNSEFLSGANFWIIHDLGTPDALIPIKVGSFVFSINILPIIMTLFNFINGFVYSKGMSSRDKAQIFLLALIFLVILYNSSSGLVLYWILNNIFSLIRNIVKKRFNYKIFYYIFCIFFILIAHLFVKRRFNHTSLIMLLFAYFFMILPYLSSFIPFLKKNYRSLKCFLEKMNCFLSKNSFLILLLSGFALSLLCGYVLPSNIIASSPVDFLSMGENDNPLYFIFLTSSVFWGFFVFWPIVIYNLFKIKIKALVPLILFSFLICAIFNVFIFKSNYGVLDVSFKLANPKCLIVKNSLFILVPFELLLLSIILYTFAFIKQKQKILQLFLLALCIGEFFLGTMNVFKIDKTCKVYSNNLEKFGVKNNTKIKPEYHLSKEGKNVIVILLDRAVGPYVEDVLTEIPNIKKQFDGFKWYSNTMSFSNATVTGAPPIYGGYEYVQEEMNKRNTELLREKNKEAHLLMPKLFVDGGFSATLANPTWPNYSYGDLSGYDKYPDITVKNLDCASSYRNIFIKEKHLGEFHSSSSVIEKQLINFSFLQTSFPKLRKKFYTLVNINNKTSVINNLTKKWIAAFAYIYYLPELTDLNSQKNSFVCMHSNAVHDTYANPGDDFESTKQEDADLATMIYRNQVAAFKQLGKFFDYLRKNDVYDNTRIIIVSDHGAMVERNNKYNDNFEEKKLNYFTALLLYKDFNSNSPIQNDSTFMTTADTVFLAKKDLNLSEKNPFTGKLFEQNKKGGIKSYGCMNQNANQYPNETTFELKNTNGWFVRDNIYDERNWVKISEWEKMQAKEGK